MATGLRPMMSVCGLNSSGLNLDEQSVECSLGEIPAAVVHQVRFGIRWRGLRLS